MSFARRVVRMAWRDSAARFPLFLAFTLCAALDLAVRLAAQEKPILKVDEDCAAFDFAADGRIAYAVRRIMATKHYDVERDDIWIVTPEGKKTRIVNGEKLVRSYTPFSYAIQSLRWSPDGRRLTVEMLTSQVVDAKGTTREGQLVDLLEEDGKEIKIEGTHDSVIEEATQATWLGDGVTVAFLLEAAKPKLLYSVGTVRPVRGRGGPIFPGHTFSAVAWDANRNTGIAIERDRSLNGPIRLVKLDLLKESRHELAVLDGFLGQLTISPSGAKVAYFRDGDTLEVRVLAAPDRVTRVPVAYGRYEWAADDRRILLKRGPERKSGDLIWVSLLEGKFEPALHDLVFKDFQISPGGRWLGVTEPGRRSLLVYPLH